jgi:serine/threonine-protein kinase RsbW
MIWVGSFKSLQSVLRKPRFSGVPLEVHTWVRSDIGLISPLVDWLMNLIAESRCVRGEAEFVELALREALSNAMLHGNRLDARKLVHVRCCYESGEGVFIVIRDQGHGFDPNRVPDPLALENLGAEHRRGIHLMKLAMDEVSFERRGTEVHMRKGSGCRQETPAWHPHDRIAGRLVSRPSPGVRVVEFGVRGLRHSAQGR